MYFLKLVWVEVQMYSYLCYFYVLWGERKRKNSIHVSYSETYGSLLIISSIVLVSEGIQELNQV